MSLSLRLCVLWVAIVIPCVMPFSNSLGYHSLITHLRASTVEDASNTPQAFSSGYSTKTNLVEALQEATQMALTGMPSKNADLVVVSVSSLYDGNSLPTDVVPTILKMVEAQHIMGCSVAGCVSSSISEDPSMACRSVEYESIPSVSVTLAQLPDVTISTFVAQEADIPDDLYQVTPEEWSQSIGLSGVQSNNPIFWLTPSPGFTTELDNLLRGLKNYYSESQTFGAVASTVSSLSRAKLFRYSRGMDVTDAVYTSGCVGVALEGDIRIETMVAQGAKPVGGIYKIVKGQESTINVIVQDEEATAALQEDEGEMEDEDEEEDADPNDARAVMMQAYSKAMIPKPTLAEANFLMKTLSDDDQAFMRRTLLIGLEQMGTIGRSSASELVRLAEGQGHRFTVHQVASAGMKDGSVTLPLGSVAVVPGSRMRFFVRDSGFARREVDALWTGYKKRKLNEQFQTKDEVKGFSASACWMSPTLDRGNKFFGRQAYESGAVTKTLASLPCISGFFSNAVIGQLQMEGDTRTAIQGSATGYTLIGSKSDRPVYSAKLAARERERREEEKRVEIAKQKELELENQREADKVKSSDKTYTKAPRDAHGELVLKRREVHSGRALTVSTVEWSVAEKTAKPSSVLEGFMWDKETEVDRFRERVPLANLVSQCRLLAVDPKAPKPRGFVNAMRQVVSSGQFILIPECKRLDPATGSLRRRYDVDKLAHEFTLAGAPALSVNCDPILFGGSLEDVKSVRSAVGKAILENAAHDGMAVPPILASDLVLYPYQLYKLRMAGADAVNIFTSVLTEKDSLYLVKIAASLQLQILVTVTSVKQLDAAISLPEGNVHGVIVSNRNLEDFGFDMSGSQALAVLQSEAMQRFREKHADAIVLVEGRVGIIENEGDPMKYMEALREAGGMGAIVAGALAEDGTTLLNLLRAKSS